MFLSNAVKYMSIKKLTAKAAVRTTGYLGTLHLTLSVLLSLFLFSTSANAVNVLVTGGDQLGPYATERLFENGDLVGKVDRPDWLTIRNWTTEYIANHYDVFIVPYNTADWQYDVDWRTRILPLLAAGKGIVWEANMTTGTGGNPLILEQRGMRYQCLDGTICWIPNAAVGTTLVPETILPVSGLTDGLTGDMVHTFGYFADHDILGNTFPGWDPALSPFIQVDAVDLNTITYGLYGDYSSGRIVFTQHDTDQHGTPTGTPAEVGAYTLLKNMINWTSSRGAEPDPNLRWVPDLIGMADTDAYSLAGGRDLASIPTYQPTNWQAPGTVMFQHLHDINGGNGGDGAFAGDILDLTVAATPSGAATTVPDITGLNQRDADLALLGAGLGSECCVSGSSATVPAGEIISQFPRAGATSTTDSVVTSSMSTGPKPGYSPQLKLMNQTEAAAALNASGFVLGSIVYKSHPVMDAGTILDQFPPENSFLADGTAVGIVVSSGPTGTMVAVPDVVGQTETSAATAMTAAGLSLGNVRLVGSQTVPAGEIISQVFLAGTMLGVGSAIDVTVSSGPGLITVPDVVGQTQATAAASITAAGLPVGTTTTAFDDTIAAGSIISTTPAAGEQVLGGTEVQMVVSDGPDPGLTLAPDVVLLTEADAVATLTDSTLVTLGTVSYEYSDAFPVVDAGLVKSQDPGANALITIGTPINIVVSLGPAPILTPDLIGLTETAAKDAIIAADLVPGPVAYFPSTAPVGEVIGQDPLIDYPVAPGEIVYLTVSSGTTTYTTVPAVLGLTETDAGTVLTGQNLVAGTVTTQDSATVPAGRVISQDVSAGSSVAEGTAVNLVVSTGTPPVLVTVPDVVGSTQADAEAAILAANLVVGVVTSANDPVVPAGDVISQNPAGDTSVAEGSAVDLVISLGPVPLVPPVANAGVDQSVTEGDSVNLDGTGSSDADGTIVSYSWTQIAGAAVTLTDATTATPSFTAPAAPDTLTFSLTVTDNDGQTDSDTVSVIVNAAPVAAYEYYVLNPLVVGGSMTVVSLSDGNTITAGGTSLTLNSGESGTIPAADLAQGARIAGTGPFDMGGTQDNTDMPVPGGFASTEFVIPHYRSTHLYYLLSPNSAATATVNIGGVITTLNLTQGVVTEFDAGSATTLSGIVTSDVPILMAHRTSDNRDAYPVAPPSLEAWGVRSNNIIIGALQDTTNLTVYASDGTSASFTLDAGGILNAAVGSSGSEGAGNAIHIVADKPIAAIQGADSDGLEATGFWSASYHATAYALPVAAQYVAVVCPSASTTVTLNDGGAITAQTCSASGATPGKAYFGSTTDGANIGAGATISSDQPIYLYYEEAVNSDEHNLIGNVSFAPIPEPDISVPSVTGLTQAAAESAIAAAGLSIGSETTANSDTVPAGDVISQNPAADTLVFAGDPVDLVISLGPAPNLPPVADAGSNRTVNEGDTVNLDGTGSSDPDGTIVSYSWVQTGGPAVTLTGSATATPNFTAPLVDADTVLSFELTVTDNDGDSDTASVDVTVLDVPAPPPGPVQVFFDSFENGAWNGLWTEDAQNDWFVSTQRATSGTHSAEVDGFASNAQLISIPIDLQGGTDATITFNWYIESGLDTGEYLAFDVSLDGGATWTEYRRLRGNVDTENVWHTEQVDLTGISSLRLRFRGNMSGFREDADVDEVSVVVQ